MTERSMRMLAELDAAAQPVFEGFLERLDKELGEDRYIVYEGKRSRERQTAYYAQGRRSLEEVNALREAAGLYLLRGDRDNYKITWTLGSKHIDGLAMDVLPVDGGGNPTWDLGHYGKAFASIRACGRLAGLVCGADWPAPQTDWPHYEMRQG